MPLACDPLWQVTQLVATLKVLWSTRAPVQVVVRWQVTQLAVVTMWLPGLPPARVPLWQLTQLVAAVKVLWSTRAPVHRVVL
ncbi:hypothetical protein D3C72_2211730 [compost metagenome]